jgi:iron complex outermembrane receptor protein
VLNGSAGTFNVGSAKIYGAELQAVALFGEGGRIDLNAAWLHTRFGDNITVTDGGGTDRQIGGHQLPNAPKLSVSGGIEYAIPAFGGTLTRAPMPSTALRSTIRCSTRPTPSRGPI